MYHFFKLQNGLQIAFYKMDSIKSVALKALLMAGPIIENEESNGASHFIEHIVLDGTRSYPSKMGFATYLESLGISYNGYTSTQEVSFEMDIPYTNLYPAISLMKEILFEPAFTDEMVENERGVILEEMQDRENSPDFLHYYRCADVRFKQKRHPLNIKVIGTKEVISTISGDKLRDLYRKLFVPENICLCLVGNFSIEEAQAYIENEFGALQNGSEPIIRPKFSMEDLSNAIVIADEHPKFENVYSNMSFPGYPREIDTKTFLEIRMFSALFGGLRTSRLFHEVREVEGLVYNIGTDVSSTWGIGTFNISFESDVKKLDRILEIVYANIKKVVRDGVSEEEVEHIKNYLNNRLLLSFSSPWKINNWLTDYIYNNEPILYPEDLIEAGKKITKSDVQEVIVNLFDFSRLNLVLMGKLDGYNPNKILETLS